jgi:hypothetical protein
MKYYIVPFHTVYNDVKKIIVDNKDDFQKTFGDVEVDYPYFLAESSMGKAFVCMMVDKEVNGIAGFIFNENATQKETTADNVMFFVEKPYRGKKTKEFMKFCNESLSKLGANKVNFTIKSDAFGRILKMYGFKPEYTTWSINCE